jgi:hypothetical protein
MPALQVQNIFEAKALDAMSKCGADSLPALQARVKGVAQSKWDNYGAAVLQVRELACAWGRGEHGNRDQRDLVL